MFTRLVFYGLLLCTLSSRAAVLFPANSTWRFWRGTSEASLPDTTAWRQLAFNDAGFANAPAPFWYGDARPGGTQLTDMQNNYTCIFLRKTFTVANAAEIGGLRMDYFIDDGFVAWVNGIEVFRENVTGDPLTIGTLAANQATDPAPLVSAVIPLTPGTLVNGTNLIAVQVFNTSSGSSDLGFDCALQSIVSETVPPTIVSVEPMPGDLTTLTEVTVTFSEPVVGVNADDFLINTQPASSVSGSGATYTFTFAQPNFGNVSISWFPTHGITDAAVLPNAFDGTAPGATWMYTLRDTIPPTVATLFPQAGVTVRSLSQVEVTFSEEVTGVDAADLLINNQPASSVTRAPGGPYVFQFADPLVGTVNLRWATGHGITDQAVPPNPFAGGSWTYVLDPNAPLGDLVITEFLASNQNGLRDEEGQEEDWIEIYNRGGAPVDLAGWSLSDDPDLPSLWVFPSRLLGPGQYLVVFASGKDRKNPTGPNRFHTNFQLAGGGEFLGLYTPDSPRVLASEFNPYPEQRNDHSYGRDPQGNLRYFASPTPGAPNGTSTITGVVQPVHFSSGRGNHTQPFDLQLSCPTPGATIRYTRDGSVPTLLNGRVYFGGLRLTNTTLIRAAAFRTNLLPSTVTTHTYFFNLSAAHRSLPVMSIVTAVSNLFGRTGILGMGGGGRASDGLFITNNPATDYHNPSAHGIAWERPVSVEYINTADNSGFQIDCGIRVQGSDWQRPRTMPNSKFSFRLYFRGDYGPGRLEYPLYPLTSVQSFDQVVLRAGFNDTGPPSEPFIRDETTRRMSHDMGQVASHGSYVNVFTNGGYAGFYNPCERVHEEFMQSYFGGGSEWDVVGPTFAQSSEGPGIIDGDRNDFNNFMNYVWSQQSNTTITNPAVYREVARRLDLVNFVDYCLLHAYVAMGDWPANNWRAARERSTNGIWRFIGWDCEWAMGIFGLTVTRDSFAFSGSGTEDAGLNSTGNSEIARIYQRLRPNREFRLLWADRIHKHFFNNGALTGGSVSNHFNLQRAQLLGVIPSMQTEILDWARQRHAIIMGQFNTYGLYGYSNALYGLYASSNAPVLSQHGGRVAPGFNLTMTAPLGGTIYYTTNGHDPRVPFTGGVSNAALAYAGPITLPRSLPIKARTLHNGTNWSAAADVIFEVGTLGIPLRLTEIMYNPPGGTIHEFIELQNVGGVTLDLGGMYFDEGINYTFLEGMTLAPGARLVLANNTDPTAFAAQYPGVAVAGYFSGNLNNAGERLTLRRPSGEIILSVDYDDAGGWATAADGMGSSLEIIDPYGNPDDPANWRASAQSGGSPGTFVVPPSGGSVVLNEVMAENLSAVNHGGTYPDWIELHNAAASEIDLDGWSLTDDGNARKFVFPSGTQIAAGGHLVVWCDAATNTTPGLHAGFALDRGGDQVFLYDANTNRIDALGFGLQLADSSVGRVSSGEWVLTTPTPGAANTAAAIGFATELVINEWLANPLPGQDDWIELHNRSATLPVALRGLYVGTSNAVQQITSLSFIAPGGFVQLLADEGVGPRHLDFKLPASPGAIVLYDAAAVQVDKVIYPAQSEGVSRGRLPDGSAAFANFPGSASPGASNYAAAWTGPVINEVLARNVSAVTNAGRVADFVEIYNPNPDSFNLGGLSLSVGAPEPGQWTFPPNTLLDGQGYLVIWCDGGRPASTAAGDFNTGRSLDGESGGVYLFNAAGQLVNSVEYGVQLPDQPIGVSGGTWRLLAAATPGAPNSAPVALGTNAALRINEWMANPDSGPDWLELYNLTNAPVDLSGLILTDNLSVAGTNVFRVPPLSFIGPLGFVKFIADSDPEQGRHHVRFSLDAQGESLRLYAANGAAIIDTVTFGVQRPGVSEGRLLDGGSSIVRFVGSASPGAPNYLPAFNVVINELLTHASGPLEDAVELFNPTSDPAPIGGWYLSDSQQNFRKYRIPGGAVIPAGGFAVIYENQFNDGSLNAFSLSAAHGGEVWLSAADGDGNLTGYRTGAQFGSAAANVSFGRHVTALGLEYVAFCQHTFGADNPATVEQFRTGTGAPNACPLVGPIVLNEIMYHPPESPDRDDEFIELLNMTNAAVSLYDVAHPANTWRLGGGVDFAFPQNQTLPANSFALVVNFDPNANPAVLAAFRAKFNVPDVVPVYGPYNGKLGNEGDTVELLMPGPLQPPMAPDAGFVPLITVDKIEYSHLPPWPADGVDGGGLSLQREMAGLYGNDPENWVAAAPTAGAPNGPGIVTPPVITQSPQSQTVLANSTVVLQAAASGPGPLTYQWRVNGARIQGATNAALVLEFAQPEDDGVYDVFVSNEGGSAFSQPATLLVNAPPQILIGPQSQNIGGGSNVTFTVTAAGSMPLFYQWRFNGVDLPNAAGPTLTLTSLVLEQTGTYTVVVSNRAGVASASANLLVLVRPSITLQPISQTGVQGGSATFTIAAAGTLPIGFRWRRAGTTYTNAIIVSTPSTSSLTVTNLKSSDATNYNVALTNLAGVAPVSSNAFLTVLADSDGDGIPDSLEPLDGLADDDGDGASNAAEYFAGTDYLDPESYLRVHIADTGTATIWFNAVAGRSYSVQYTDGLNPAVWQKFADVLAGTGNRVEQLVDSSPGTNRYYRLVTPIQR